MRRFEGLERGKQRFYEIETEGKKVIVRSGLVGSSRKPVTTTEEWANAKDATAQAAALSKEKLRQKLSEVKAPSGQRAKTARPKEIDARAFVTAILADRDAGTPWLVYADALQAAGDPRGELIVVQEARSRAPKDRKLRLAEEALLDEHYKRLVGDTLSGHLDGRCLTVSWKNGFFHEAWIKDLMGEFDGRGRNVQAVADDSPPLEEVASDLFGSPSGALLDALTIESRRSTNDEESDTICTLTAIAERLAGMPTRAPLRSLSLVRPYQANQEPVDANRLLAAFPTLRALSLEASVESLDDRRLQLESLSIDATGGVLSTLLAKPWPNLRRLTLGSRGIELADLAAICATDSFPNLEHFSVRHFGSSDLLAKRLAKSPFFPRLKSLELSRGNLTAEGAATLASVKRKTKLDHIDVTRNRLHDRAKQTLRTIAHDVIAAHQKG